MTVAVRTLGGFLLVLGLLTGLASLEGQETDKPTVTRIGYADLGKFVRSHSGKVVVVDFWANF